MPGNRTTPTSVNGSLARACDVASEQWEAPGWGDVASGPVSPPDSGPGVTRVLGFP